MQTTKELRAELKEWLDANSDKTERDWLIGRCSNETEKAIIINILNVCDERGIKYEIAPGITFSGWIDLAVDLIIIDKWGGRYLFDMATPAELFDSYNPKRPWPAAFAYIRWKTGENITAVSLGDGTSNAEKALSIYKGNGFLHDYYIDWRNPAFLEELKK